MNITGNKSNYPAFLIWKIHTKLFMFIKVKLIHIWSVRCCLSDSTKQWSSLTLSHKRERACACASPGYRHYRLSESLSFEAAREIGGVFSSPCYRLYRLSESASFKAAKETWCDFSSPGYRQYRLLFSHSILIIPVLCKCSNHWLTYLYEDICYMIIEKNRPQI